MSNISLTFQCGELILEGRLHLPRNNEGTVPGVILCHPHPLYGGNMDNNVVMAVANALTDKGIGALRFNFRGVGLSKGSFDDGEGEQNDARAALAALATQPGIDSSRLGIFGYSFGGLIALAVGSWSEDVGAIGAVSPVVVPGILQGAEKPVFLTCGTHDHVVSPEALDREVKQMALPGKVEVVQDVDHFWWGYETQMAEQMAGFFADQL